MSTDALTVITEDIYSVKAAFQQVQADQTANFEREAGFAIQILSANRYSMDTAMANRQSVVDAVVNVAAIGVSLNPAKKQAYLVPRDGKICLDISYMGLMDLAQATGSVRWAQAALVYAGDTFALTGLDRPPKHEFNPFSTDRGAIVGVYVTVKTSDGDYLTHTMTIADVYDIRDRSAYWKKKQSGPWLTDEGEMIKKTCVKQACKYWPRADRLDAAIQHLNVDNGEGLESIAMMSEMDKLAAEMVQLHYEEKNTTQACVLWYDNERIQTSNEAREYCWGQLKEYSALRSAIKANKPAPAVAIAA